MSQMIVSQWWAMQRVSQSVAAWSAWPLARTSPMNWKSGHRNATCNQGGRVGEMGRCATFSV
eukprot:3132455-Prymnesium_polylepis.1